MSEQPTQPPESQQRAPLSIDRDALIEALREPSVEARANADWCIACGAGAAAAPELPMAVQQEVVRDPELLKSLMARDFVDGLARELSTSDLNADWCIACGASAATAPQLRVSPATQATLSDRDIEQIVSQLLSRRA